MIHLTFSVCSHASINITVNPQPAILSYPVTIEFHANALSRTVTWFYAYNMSPLTNTTRTRQYKESDGYYYLEILNTTKSDETLYRAVINNNFYCDVSLSLKSK